MLAVDKSESCDDLLIDYNVFETCRAAYVRLTLVGACEGITPAVTDFTVFGVRKIFGFPK
jgi:hypothetical protein